MDPGLGKTLTALQGLRRISQSPEAPGRILLIAGVNAQYVWIDEELPKWSPELVPFIVPIQGPPTTRQKLWDSLKTKTDFIAVVTIQSLQRDITLLEKFSFDFIIMDECHKARNRKTKNYKVLKDLSKRTRSLFLLTGSLVSRGPQDLWALLNCCNPQDFPSYWAFLNKYCTVVQGNFGIEIGGPRNITELREVTRRYIFTKTKKDEDVVSTIPKKNRQLLPVKMDPTQARLYKELSETLMAEYGDDFIVTRSQLALFTRHRQLLICPRILFPEATMGAGFSEILEKLEDASRADQHCVIYSPHTAAFPYVKAALIDKGYAPGEIVTFQGGMSQGDIKVAKERFVSTRGIALMSISYAESISLETASYGYFLGPDLDVNVNYQAEDRIHRMTSTRPVFLYYIDYKDTISEYIFANILGFKAYSINRSLGEVRVPYLKNLLGAQ